MLMRSPKMMATEFVPDIIRLQLRKPKSWNWQLSTSKSSPHITLPIIQLYDYKGQLLVEARDESGNGLRRSWGPNVGGILEGKFPREIPNHLKRCRSDTLDFEKCDLLNGIIEQDEKGGTEQNRIDSMLSTSKSKRSSRRNFKELDVKSQEENKSRRHRRSKSDDLFRRKLRYSSEESVKRAEIDGYRNFITPNMPTKEPQLQPPTQNKPNKNGSVLQSSENVLVECNPSSLEESDIKHKKYKTRTCSAGTLVITDESFYAQRSGRRRRRSDRVSADFPVPETAAVPARGNSTIYRPRNRSCSAPYSPKSENACLFYSKSDVFVFDDSIAANGRHLNPEKVAGNPCGGESRKVTAGRSSKDEKSEAMIEKLNGKKPRKFRREACDSLTSSSVRMQKGGDAMRKSKGHLIKEHSASTAVQPDKAATGGGSELLRLVRRLSTSAGSEEQEDRSRDDDHADKAMGANVSRHSAKGLSGRRSRSSGSICGGGKGTAGGNAQCSSLPSYLDEDGKPNGCNNNKHECDKSGIDEVDRIPPLGDGAPLHWKFSDGGGGGGGQTAALLCDQGYGSERSPEEEYPPPLPDHHHLQCHHHLEPHHCYPFVTPESTFTVKLTKGSRGLGLSVTGGVDSASGSWPGLVRIKRLFPHQPASSCNLLNVGDLLLEANGVPLTGLTNYEALEVLRTSSNHVELRVCRPPPDVLNCVSPISEVPPPPPRREPPNTLSLPSSTIYSTPEDNYYHGEFEITLEKIQGSLGFTLRKEDDSALGHYVRALVREPALTDGRIKAGDKIIAVNDVEICLMTHEQAVQFLRQCPEIVKLRLYRDSAQTPVATLSPSETTPRTSFSRKSNLRQEAVDMLNDIAGRKLSGINHDTYVRSMSPNSSPRRLRRNLCPSETSNAIDYEQFHEGLLQQCSSPFNDDAFNSLFCESDDGDKPSRPSSLDLYNPNQTPVAARKPRFNFSLAHNAYELNNLDPEVLDAPNLTYNLGNEELKGTESEGHEPASMPHISTNNLTFSYKNPAYQSAHPQINSDLTEPTPARQPVVIQKEDSVKKRKNVQDNREIRASRTNREHPMKEEYEVLAIELNRGWNSRLGFSLQGAAGVTYVSAVHADSVAAKDGRLKPGDRLIKVNDESIEHMTTSEIIDLLRIVRGPVCIVISRVKSNEDCYKSNAEN